MDDLDGVVSRIAERVHEVWMEKRLAEGWRLGPERNDTRKEHPCLVPYADLPELEREYDRATARTVIQALLAEGYELLPPSNEGAS
jgi:hypothetical protein